MDIQALCFSFVHSINKKAKLLISRPKLVFLLDLDRIGASRTEVMALIAIGTVIYLGMLLTVGQKGKSAFLKAVMISVNMGIT